MNSKIEPSLKSIEDALLPLKGNNDRSFDPPENRGIHELLTETKHHIHAALSIMEIIERRMSEFDNMQDRFYKGRRP